MYLPLAYPRHKSIHAYQQRAPIPPTKPYLEPEANFGKLSGSSTGFSIIRLVNSRDYFPLFASRGRLSSSTSNTTSPIDQTCKFINNGLRPDTRCHRQWLRNDQSRLCRRRNPKIFLSILVHLPLMCLADPVSVVQSIRVSWPVR